MRVWKLVVATTFLFLQGCERDGGVIEKVRMGELQGTFFIEDDERTTALTRVRHSVYYAVEGERSLIFEGTGGPKPTLSLLTPDTLLICYCGGSIDRASSFMEGQPSSDGKSSLIRVQPVTSAGITANGQPIC
jgi:hypothetical protein